MSGEIQSTRDVNKETGSKAKAKAPSLKAKACQLNPKDRPRPRSQLDQANNFSVKHTLQRATHTVIGTFPKSWELIA